MSAYRFTPGPWEKKFDSLRVQAVAEPKVAICFTDTFGTAGEGVGNAHLIAAAPELLEALKSAIDVEKPIVRHFYRQGNECTELCREEIWKPWVKAARAVIAKAEGK